MHSGHTEHGEKPRGWTTGAAKTAFVFFALIAGYFVVTEHTAHVKGALPYILIALCPLMHFFMHRGHHSNGTDHLPRGGGTKP